MTRQEIIAAIAAKLPYQSSPTYHSALSPYSSHNDVIVAINNLNTYLQQQHNAQYLLVEKVVTILEDYHRLTFAAKVETIINE